jgi:hypothetical protein
MARSLRASGSSMSARLLDGDRVVLSATPPEELSVGDVVAFVGHDRQVVAHRLVRIEPGPRFLTRGDGSAELDAEWGPEALVGRISRDGHLGRWIARWPRLALPLGATLRVRRAWNLPSAVLAAAIALAIQLIRWRRR